MKIETESKFYSIKSRLHVSANNIMTKINQVNETTIDIKDSIIDSLTEDNRT